MATCTVQEGGHTRQRVDAGEGTGDLSDLFEDHEAEGDAEMTVVQDILIDKLVDVGAGECEIGALYQTDREWNMLWFNMHVWAIKQIRIKIQEVMDAN